jgi:hypothetical protein
MSRQGSDIFAPVYELDTQLAGALGALQKVVLVNAKIGIEKFQRWNSGFTTANNGDPAYISLGCFHAGQFNNFELNSFAYIGIYADTIFLGVFIPGLDPTNAICRYAHVNIHRSATHLAILDAFLVTCRSICQDRDRLSAVRTANGYFLKFVHF